MRRTNRLTSVLFLVIIYKLTTDCSASPTDVANSSAARSDIESPIISKRQHISLSDPEVDKISEKSATGCEEDKLLLKCPNKFDKLVIYKTFYGRADNSTCRSTVLDSETPCEQQAAGVSSKIQELCSGENRCKVPVDADFLGHKNSEICPRIRKYLNVVYKCVQHPMIQKICANHCPSSCWPTCSPTCCSPPPPPPPPPQVELPPLFIPAPPVASPPVVLPPGPPPMPSPLAPSPALPPPQIGPAAPPPIAPAMPSICPGPCGSACAPSCTPQCCSSFGASSAPQMPPPYIPAPPMPQAAPPSIFQQPMPYGSPQGSIFGGLPPQAACPQYCAASCLPTCPNACCRSAVPGYQRSIPWKANDAAYRNTGSVRANLKTIGKPGFGYSIWAQRNQMEAYRRLLAQRNRLAALNNRRYG